LGDNINTIKTKHRSSDASKEGGLEVNTEKTKRQLGRHRRKWEDSIKMDLRIIGLSGMDWINLAQDRDSGGPL
jgi:hypothetical protein